MIALRKKAGLHFIALLFIFILYFPETYAVLQEILICFSVSWSNTAERKHHSSRIHLRILTRLDFLEEQQRNALQYLKAGNLFSHSLLTFGPITVPAGFVVFWIFPSKKESVLCHLTKKCQTWQVRLMWNLSKNPVCRRPWWQPRNQVFCLRFFETGCWGIVETCWYLTYIYILSNMVVWMVG